MDISIIIKYCEKKDEVFIFYYNKLHYLYPCDGAYKKKDEENVNGRTNVPRSKYRN